MAGGDADVGALDAGTTADAALHLDEGFALEDAQRFSHDGSGHVVQRHELRLVGQGVVGLELTEDDPPPDATRYHDGGFREYRIGSLGQRTGSFAFELTATT